MNELRVGRSWDRIPVGSRYSARSDLHWGPPSLLYNGYRVFPGGRCGRGVRLTPNPIPSRPPWGPPNLLYNGYRVFPGDRSGRGVRLTPQPHLVPKVLEKSRAIPLLTLRTCVAYKKGENLPIAVFSPNGLFYSR